MVAIKLIALVAGLLALALAGLGLNILFRKNGKFPETHVGHNREMRKRGVSCASCEEKGGCQTNSYSRQKKMISSSPRP
jgi:hypothetical protein